MVDGGLRPRCSPSTIHYLLSTFSASRMAKQAPQIDVLVLGQHPCAYLAAELLHCKGGVNVAHATIPADNPPDRLVIVNPQLFALHKPLEKLRKKLELTAVWGAVFLGDTRETRGE